MSQSTAMKTQSSQSKTVVPAAFGRFRSRLKESGLSDRSVGFLLGRLTRVVTDGVAAESVKLFGKDTIKSLSEIKNTSDRQKEFEKIFLEKKGVSVASYRDELAEKVVRDFEKQRNFS